MLTKNQQIAALEAKVEALQADKAELIEMLHLALGPKKLGASTERTRRWRDRHSDGHSDANGASQKRHSDAGGTIGGSTSLFEGGDVTENGSQEDQSGSWSTPEGGAGGNKRHKASQSDAPDPEWDVLKDVFPVGHRRTNWTKARTAWKRLSQADRLLAARGVVNYAHCSDVLRGCEMAAQRWLNERTWELWQEPEILLPPLVQTAPREPVGMANLRKFQEDRARQEANGTAIEGQVVGR